MSRAWTALPTASIRIDAADRQGPLAAWRHAVGQGGFSPEPLPPDDLDGYRRLCDASPIRIAAGEEEATVHGFRDLIERGHLHVVQPDVARAGGVTETMRIAAFAHAHNVPCVPHHYSTGILGAVSVHVNASIPNRLFQETPAPGEGSPLNTDLVVPAVKLDADGCIVIPPGPGLGIELDQEVVDRYRVA